jgi:uncharacterized protein YcgI (DUF1989 family)
MQVVSETIMEPGGRHHVRVAGGDSLSLYQVEGGQVADLVAVTAEPPHEYLSMWMSCAVNRSWQLTAPHVLVTERGRRMCMITKDTCGANYCGGGYCNPALNSWWHNAPTDPTCEGNIKAGLREIGVDPGTVTGDACLNLWMRVDYEPDGTWVIHESPSRPDDYVTFAAETDLYVAISNCPATRTSTNAGRLKPLVVRHCR